MSDFKIDYRTLQLFAAQANLNGSFNHTCSSPLHRQRLSFRLHVERGASSTTFTVDMLDARHSVTLSQNHPKIHHRIAELVEGIANGKTETADGLPSWAESPSLSVEESVAAGRIEQVRELLRKGGVLTLDVGLQAPVQLAVHRSRSPDNLVTSILSIGTRRPHTSTFTTRGSEAHAMEVMGKKLDAFIRSATPNEQAA